MDFLYNLTGVDLDVYFAANTTAYTLLFFTIALPTLILCLLCVMALFFADNIKWKIRVLLINMFAAEICHWIGFSTLFLGFPTRFCDNIADDFTCKITLNFFFINIATKFSASALYAVMVYIFLKHGIKKVKWSVIAISLLAIWALALAVGVQPYVGDLDFNNAGFCESDANSIPYIIVIITEMIISVCITVVFGFLTLCYVRNNTLEGNTAVKKSIARHLFYLVIAAVLALIGNVVPASFSAVRGALVDRIVVSIALGQYVLRVSTALIQWLHSSS